MNFLPLFTSCRCNRWPRRLLLHLVILGMKLHIFYDNEVLHSKHWYASDAWESGNPQKQPHVMLTLAHKYEGNDSSLLRGEVLAIIAVMLS